MSCGAGALLPLYLIPSKRVDVKVLIAREAEDAGLKLRICRREKLPKQLPDKWAKIRFPKKRMRKRTKRLNRRIK